MLTPKEKDLLKKFSDNMLEDSTSRAIEEVLKYDSLIEVYLADKEELSKNVHKLKLNLVIAVFSAIISVGSAILISPLIAGIFFVMFVRCITICWELVKCLT